MCENGKATAFHEAGHVVVAYRQNLYVGDVTVVPDADNDTMGTSCSEAEWGDGSTDIEQIITLFAGRAAQLRHSPESDTSGCCRDDADAVRLLKCHPEWTEGELREAADKMVENNWAHISAIAEALEEFGRVKGDEATLIVDAIDEHRDWRVVLSDYLSRRPPGCI